jgi:hypothetical protein
LPAILILATVRPVEEVHLRLGHRQNAGQLDAAEAQLVGDGVQDGALVGLDLAIGEGGLQLHLEEEAQDIALALAGRKPPGLRSGKSASLPWRNDSGREPLLACQPHPSIRLEATRISCSVTWPLALAM